MWWKSSPSANGVWNSECTAPCDALCWLHRKSRVDRSTHAALHTHCPLREVWGCWNYPQIWTMCFYYIAYCALVFLFLMFSGKISGITCASRPRWVPWAALVLVSQLCWAALGLCDPEAQCGTECVEKLIKEISKENSFSQFPLLIPLQTPGPGSCSIKVFLERKALWNGWAV